MQYDPLIVWKEMRELIPKMREAVVKGLKRDFEKVEHDDMQIKIELDFLNDALHFLQKKWTLDLIYVLRILKEKGQPPFFNDIRRALPNLNSRTLTTRLKEFGENKIVKRTVTNTQPIRVHYELTDLGNGIYELLLPLLMFFSGKKHGIELKK
jgi:DNA-binding HxlR family transcriptional regulator